MLRILGLLEVLRYEGILSCSHYLSFEVYRSTESVFAGEIFDAILLQK